MQESLYDDQPKQREKWGGGSWLVRHGQKPNKDRLALEHDGYLCRGCFSLRPMFDDEECRRMFRMRAHFFLRIIGAICNTDSYFLHVASCAGHWDCHLIKTKQKPAI